jgi:hypothetical protein
VVVARRANEDESINSDSKIRRMSSPQRAVPQGV